MRQQLRWRVYLQAYEAVSAARSDLDTYIDWYNREACIRASRTARPGRSTGRCCPSWPWLPKMKTPVRPELPSPRSVRRTATTTAVDNSATLQPARSLFTSRGKTVQRSEATSLRPNG